VSDADNFHTAAESIDRFAHKHAHAQSTWSYLACFDRSLSRRLLLLFSGVSLRLLVDDDDDQLSRLARRLLASVMISQCSVESGFVGLKVFVSEGFHLPSFIATGARRRHAWIAASRGL
jgi:hypothetical protein